MPAVRKRVDFSNEYRYVISDLRNMAIIAIAMLAVLVALSFIIR
jgi:small-conductance mechanosensitive channel